MLSVALDDWSDDEIDAMVEVGGNSSANSIYEAFIPEGVTKPKPNSSHEERMRFIRLDERKLFHHKSGSLCMVVTLYRDTYVFMHSLLDVDDLFAGPSHGQTLI